MHTSLVPSHLLSTIYNAVQENFGEVGLGRTQNRIKVVYLALLTGMAVIRVPADFEKDARVCLASLVVVGRERCVCNVVHVGGTIRTCQKKLYSYSLNRLHRQMLDTPDGRERDQIRGVLERTLEEVKQLSY